jgi:ribosomal protein S1
MKKEKNTTSVVEEKTVMNLENITPLESFDWSSYTNNNHIFRYKDRNNLKLNNYQKQMLSFYDGVITTNQKIDAGLVVSGQIKSISKREMIVDVNYKDDIFIEHKLSEWNIVKGFNVGDSVDVLIKEIQDKPYLIKGSVIDLIKMKVDDKIVEYYNNNRPLIGTVIEVIPAGYMLNIELDKINITAFMPNTLADVNKLYDTSVLMGKQITVMLESLQQEKGVYVVSRKKYLLSLVPEKIKNLKFEKLYEGYVTGTTPFGVFVQFDGCLTGMIHKANIVEEHRERIEQIKPGTLIEFYIKEITKGNKLILTQILRESIWDSIKVGMVIEGEVVAVKPFGALVKLDYETSGLIKTSYLTKYKTQLNVGDKKNVKIININRDDRKIYLTIADNSYKNVENNTNGENNEE